MMPLRLSSISMALALGSVLAFSAVAGACSVYSTQVYTAGGSAVAAGGSVPAGTTVYDTATVQDPTGYYVTFNLYSTSKACPSHDSSYGNTAASAAGYLAGLGLVTPQSDTPAEIGKSGGNIVADPANNSEGLGTSDNFPPLAAGSYFLIAYNNAGYIGPCETFTVVKAQPTIKTQTSSSSIAAPGSFTDTATVSGGASPTGSVTFNVYSGSTCSGTPAATNSSTLSSGSATSTPFTLPVGSYEVQAVYSGDSNNLGATSACGTEPFTVTSPPPPSSPPSSPPSASLSTTPTVNGLSATDIATVSGTSGMPTGTVTFTLYSGTSPGGTATGYSNTETLSGGSATSTSTGALVAGSYYFVVTYSGNGTYSPITGSAEAFSTLHGVPTLSTTPNVIGTSATDSATVSGTSGTPTGSVTFTLYSGSPGSGTLVTGYSADTVGLTSGQASSVSTGTLAAGSYYFVVTYSGDGTYSAITPGATELFIIIPVSAPKPPKTKTTPYKIPTSAPQTGVGGSAGVTFNGGLLSIGSLMLLAGLVAMAFTRRRRNA
jgi:hypothetical protein